MLELESAQLVVRSLGLYLAIGLLIALAVAFGPGLGARVDRGLAASGGGARLLLVPGMVLLWPWLALRVARGGGEPPNESNAHRRANRRP